MAEIARKTKRYPSDLTDEEWERLAPLMPKPGRRGRPREVEFREVINAVRYLVRIPTNSAGNSDMKSAPCSDFIPAPCSDMKSAGAV